MSKKAFYKFAVDNIVKYGDTDIFPFPIENLIFYDRRNEIVDLLLKMDSNFEDALVANPPCFYNMLAASGYTSFRWATQIDPIWNAFLLGNVLSLAEKIEGYRIKKEKECVFSYRILLDDTTRMLFDESYGWRRFHEQSIIKAKKHNYVLSCDISNFYPSIYHHRLENSLSLIGNDDKATEKQILKILNCFSNGKSFGLPIGGQSSRILAELLLTRTDKLLLNSEIDFCRFVDDYVIFADSEEEIYANLLALSKFLINNEGLLLQKSKTSIMTSGEYLESSILKNEKTIPAKGVFALSLKFDPYSMTAEEDYEILKAEIANLDIMSILSQELNKTRVHTSLLKKILNTLKFLEPNLLESVILSLIENIETLAPIAANVFMILSDLFGKLNNETKNIIIDSILNLRKTNSYILQIDLNLSYAIRLLAKVQNDSTQIELSKIFKQTESLLIKKDIILIMAKWKVNHWISDLKNNYTTLSPIEKRAFILASYCLNDEGDHWRKNNKQHFTEYDIYYRDWICTKDLKNWELPI